MASLNISNNLAYDIVSVLFFVKKKSHVNFIVTSHSHLTGKSEEQFGNTEYEL